MTRSRSVPVLMANMDTAIAMKGAIQTATAISTITAEAVRTITNTHLVAGMGTTVLEAKVTMIMNRRASTRIKANQLGTMSTPGPIALGLQSVQTTAPLMLEMGTTTSASRQLEANWPLRSPARQSAQEVVMTY